jgi:hypothetical protein
MPDEDAVIAITAETPNMQDEINLVWKYLLPGMQKGKLEENARAASELKQKLSSLALPDLQAGKVPELAAEISGKTFTLAPNSKNLESLTFTFANNECTVTEKTGNESYDITFGSGTWKTGETKKPGPSLLEGAFTNTAFLYPARIAASYTWKEDNSLQLVLRYIENPHSEILVCRFDHNKLEADLMKSYDYGKNKITLSGTVKK